MTRRLLGLAPWVALIVAGVGVSTGDPYLLSVGIVTGIWALLAVGLNFLMGYTGMIHLGLGAFYAFGAYFTAIATLEWHWPIWSMLVICPTGAFILAALIGPAVLRTKGLYFAVATLGLGIIVSDVASNWIPVTKGPIGIAGIERPPGFSLGGWHFDPSQDRDFLLMLLALLVICLLIASRYHHSTIARVLVAARDDTLLASSLGFRVLPYQVFAFAASSAVAGFAGVLYAWFIRYISPPPFTFFALSFQVFVLVAVGGGGSVWGPVVGAVFLTGLPEVMSLEAHTKVIVYGFVLLAVIALLPRGIVPSAVDAVGRLRRRYLMRTAPPPSASIEPSTVGSDR